MIRIAALAAVLALAGCDVQLTDVRANEGSAVPREGDARHVKVFRDEHRNVTCWLYGPNNGGISCIPDWMLTNGQRDPLVVPEARP